MSFSQFIACVPPPGHLLDEYDRHAPPTGQSNTDIPKPFLDAMGVRESVFVYEQHVPLENEYDEDDPRSWHWVAHVSVASRGAAGPGEDGSTRRPSAANVQVPVGTIRLVPPPHPPHPTPGSHHALDDSKGAPPAPPAVAAAANHTTAKLPKDLANAEPYVKLGRLAILKPYRKLGMGRMLVEEACSWAGTHTHELVHHSHSALEAEETREAETVGRWKGLVLVHAQKHLEKTYERWGFKVDKALGVWDEEGIDHIGMWKRVALV